MAKWNHDKINRYWGIFGNITPKAPWFSEKASGWLIKNIKKEAHRIGLNKKDMAIIDLGAGSGEFLISLGKTFKANVSGMDISADRISKAAEKYPKINYFQGTLDNIPAEDNSFEIVISTQTVEHLLDEDLQKSFNEMARVLKPGGMLFITTRFNEDLSLGWKVCPDCHAVFQHSQHMQTFNYRSISELCANAGLSKSWAYRSRCRDHMHDYVPRRWRFIERITYFLLANFFDKHFGKYLVSVSKK
jgi:ubiquinone/menaquinone biosynthesis C-methylase UbiE